MPQVLLLALAGLGLWVGYRWFRRESRRVADELARAEAELKRRGGAGEAGEAGAGRDTPEAITPLEQDPETGIYRPVDRGRSRSPDEPS